MRKNPVDESPKPKYPDVVVDLARVSGNGYAILSVVQRALRKSGIPDKEIQAFLTEATSGDYDHLIQTVMGWVEIDA